MIPTRGVNHIALSVADMKRTLVFYTETLGMRLVGLFPMHGVPGATHAFLDMGGGQLLSFIAFATPPSKVQGITHPAHPGAPSAVATMHHLALGVPDAAALGALRARLLEAGVRVSDPYDHGFCTSIYFKGPDGEQLEVTHQYRPLGAGELDAETFGALGVSDAERAAMTE
jgi:catechol 2,3-dioxygenase-like lactoylglutathione lyase family enzyme